MTVELLKSLNPEKPLEALSELKLSIPQKILFASNWRKWKTSLETAKSTELTDLSVVSSYITSSFNPSTYQLPSSSELSSGSNNYVYNTPSTAQYNSLFNEQYNSYSSGEDQQPLVSQPLEAQPLVSQPLVSQPLVSQSLASNSNTSPNLTTNTVVITDNFVSKLLTSSTAGQRLLDSGARSGGILKPDQRTKLVNLISIPILDADPNRKLTAKEYADIASQINKLFPKEDCEIYYSPYRKATDKAKKSNAGGRLYSRFQSKRVALEKDGTITIPKRRKSSSSTVGDSTVGESVATPRTLFFASEENEG